jgi:hypothetical protein
LPSTGRITAMAFFLLIYELWHKSPASGRLDRNHIL